MKIHEFNNNTKKCEILAMSLCVLCGLGIVKKTDKNHVDGRKGNSFKVREKLLSLECEVEINTCNSTLPNSTSVDQWPSTLSSTPCKDKNRPVSFATLVGPVSPIPAREPEEKKARVHVTVEWPSRTKVNTLHEGLESLGKMLCRGTYKQIAGAVWKNPRPSVLFVQEIQQRT